MKITEHTNIYMQTYIHYAQYCRDFCYRLCSSFLAVGWYII